MDQKTDVIPHERVPKCGAKTRSGTPCKGFAMKNGRCKLHGGLSTGPKTKEGRQRIAAAQFKHGLRSKALREETKWLKMEIKSMLTMTKNLLDHNL